MGSCGSFSRAALIPKVWRILRRTLGIQHLCRSFQLELGPTMLSNLARRLRLATRARTLFTDYMLHTVVLLALPTCPVALPVLSLIPFAAAIAASFNFIGHIDREF